MPQAKSHLSIARLLDGYRAAVDRHDCARRAHDRTQRLFLRILKRTRLSDDAAYEAAGASLADIRNLEAYQFERVSLRRLVEAADSADDVQAVLIRGALVAAQARVRAREMEIAND